MVAQGEYPAGLSSPKASIAKWPFILRPFFQLKNLADFLTNILVTLSLNDYFNIKILGRGLTDKDNQENGVKLF